MRKSGISFLLICIAFASCNQKDAFRYSEDFANKENALVPALEKTESAVAKFYAAKKFDSITVAGGKMEEQVQKVITEISTAPEPDAKGFQKFKSAVLHYFEFIKSVYTAYRNYGMAGSDAERGKYFDLIQKITAKKGLELSRIESAQSEFARLNNFSLLKK